MDALTIALPYPPSVNHYWRHFRGRFVVSAEGKRFRTNVLAEVLNTHGRNKGLPFDGPIIVRITMHAPDKRRRDLDNTLKAMLDALAHAGVYGDDSQIVQIEIAWGVRKPPHGAATVQVEAAQVAQMSLL